MKKFLMYTVASIVWVGSIIFGDKIASIFTGKSSTSQSKEILKLEHERDSLKELSIQSLHREQQYILKMEQDSIKASGLEKSIALHESKIKTYQQRLREVMSIPVTQPDSFLLKRYPK